MRKNVQEVFTAWLGGQANKKHKSIHTDGRSVYSYSTPILYRYNGLVELDCRRYSQTTSCQQGSLGYLLNSRGIQFTRKVE